MSTIYHMAHNELIGEFFPNLLISVSGINVATTVSILFLNSGRSAGSGGTYTYSFMKPPRDIRLDELGGLAKLAILSSNIPAIR